MMTVSEAIEKTNNFDWRPPIMTTARPCPRCKSENLVRVECGDNCGTLSQVVCLDCGFEGPAGRSAGKSVKLWNNIIRGIEATHAE